ncbi:galactoside alpha-(1,2)-fucosyltransferase 1-like [Mercenaria mercenaria]|uniref:galactoside alpha-(1,2)-fucosyltransferase 1-like n=1 Tax=Mercenaria mercenaria TaxID=6596 RepID=UPI00234EE0F1|nr:galactoside alpha-(1,2)-fucosyltransferase 1-like [Mercenaria mercenaria]
MNRYMIHLFEIDIFVARVRTAPVLQGVMPEMHLVPRKIMLYTTVGIFAYIILMYVLLNLPIFAKVTSFMRHVLSSKVSSHVYGLGTVMVDVRSLGKKLSHDIDMVTNYNTRKKIKIKRNSGKARNICFDIFFNGNQIFEKKEETPNSGLCNCYITVDNPPGRSGNQMFHIAALLGTAYNLDLIPVIPTNFPLSDWLELPNLVDFNLTEAQPFVIKPSGIYFKDINNLDNKRNWTLRGYFQSWKYFLHSEHIIKNAFKIKDVYLNEAKSFIKNISRTGLVNVCVHVRRGDLSDSVAMRKGYAIAGLDFIYNAMNFYRRKFKNVQFIVLSDGIFWCIENIKGNDIIFSPFYRYAEDMALMTLCNHVIVTSGTFGWWGAWLSGGTTVYFNGYPRPESWLATQINKKDYYPKDWIAL